MIGRGGHRRAGGTPLAICKSQFSGKEQLKKKQEKASNSNSMFSFVVIKNVSSSTPHNSHI
jgi:hypothetical protein